MADIELVIKIPEGLKKDFELEQWTALSCMEMKNALEKAKSLPKGHGRLIDGSKLKVELECGIRAGNYEEGYEKYGHINSMDDCVDAVEYADTVIEADEFRPGNLEEDNEMEVDR